MEARLSWLIGFSPKHAGTLVARDAVEDEESPKSCEDDTISSDSDDSKSSDSDDSSYDSKSSDSDDSSDDSKSSDSDDSSRYVEE